MGSSVTIPCANGNQSQGLKELEKMGEISESTQGYSTPEANTNSVSGALRCEWVQAAEGVRGPREHRTAVRRVQPRQGREGSG